MFIPRDRSGDYTDLLHKDRIYFASRSATDDEIINYVLPAFEVVWGTMKDKYKVEEQYYHFFPPTEYRIPVKGRTKGQTFLLGHAAFISEDMLTNIEFLPAVLAYMCGGIEHHLGMMSLMYRCNNPKEFDEPEVLKAYPPDIVFGGGNDFTSFTFEGLQGFTAVRGYLATQTSKYMETYVNRFEKAVVEESCEARRNQYRADEFAAFECGQRDALIRLLQRHQHVVTQNTADVIHYNNTIADRIRYLQGSQTFRDTTWANVYNQQLGQPAQTEQEYLDTHTIDRAADEYLAGLDAKLEDLRQNGEQSQTHQELVEYLEKVMSRKS